MKRLELIPTGFPCTLAECPAGFFLKDNEVCFKSEYFTNDRPDAYCEGGCYFWGGDEGKKDINAVIVQPLISAWFE